VAVDAARLFDREKILGGDRLQGRRGDGHRLGHTRNAQRTCEALHFGHVLGDRRVRRCLADGVRDVDGEKIACPKELVDRGEADMIGVDEIGVRPLARLDRGFCLGAHVFRAGPDQGVFAVRLVPHRRDPDAAILGRLKGPQLRRPFQAKAVPNPHGVLRDAFRHAHIG